MRFDVITIFPDLFTSFKKEALISRAQEKKLISINTHFLRDYANDAHKTVDDRPYGGGAGMVLMVEPIFKAVEEIKKQGSTFLGSWSKSLYSNGRIFGEMRNPRLNPCRGKNLGTIDWPARPWTLKNKLGCQRLSRKFG